MTTSRPTADATGPATAQTLKRLAALLSAYAPHDGRFELPVRGTHAIRLSHATDDSSRATIQPMLCVVAQGTKTVQVGREMFEYSAARLATFFVDLPIAGRVVGATRQHPFLCFRLDLDPYRIAELALRVYPDGVPPAPATRGWLVTASQEGIVDAVTRLIPLMADPRDAQLLAPLVIDEILIRLLRSPVGSRVAQVGRADSGMRRIAQAVIDIREQFTHPLAIDGLARRVHMSASSFHQHFKAVTSMSPLQYQKVLRLQEARRLMLSQGLDAQSAANTVGYVSPSQFSREYARLFGNAPTRDIARLRETDVAAHRA